MESDKQKEVYAKWTHEKVWTYRNERGEIMRAQDIHPSKAVEQAEELYRKGEGNEG